MSKLKEKLAKIESIPPSCWKESEKYRRENRKWVNKSSSIAIKVIGCIKSSTAVSERFGRTDGLSPLQIIKIVKGQKNLALKTMSTLKMALGIKISTI